METKLKKILKTGPKTNRELRSELEIAPTQFDPKLDRALQKLRKDGKIRVVQRRWALATVETCPTCKGKGWVATKTKAAKASK